MEEIKITGEELLKEKCIFEIRIKIETARINVAQGMDGYEAFNTVYDYMTFFQKCGLLGKGTLDTLWRELQEATNII